MNIGSRVDTPYGAGEVVGIEFKGEHYQRYIVALDCPDKWTGSAAGWGNPAFFRRDISMIERAGN